MGMPKAPVLPLPVRAWTMRSCPSRIRGMTRSWTGVGVVQPSSSTPLRTSSGRFSKTGSVIARHPIPPESGPPACYFVRVSVDAPGIDPEDLRRLADLARLEVGEEEALALAKDLARILDFVRQLQGLDTEGVPPTSHVMELATPLRRDEPAPPLPPEEALGNAPAHEGTAFLVPQVLDSDEA